MPLTLHQLGQQDYQTTFEAMRTFSQNRTHETADEIWIVEHAPVYTLGLNGKTAHLLNPGSIPVLKTDRGGQVTYHGPGQLVIYVLLDMNRAKLGVRELVSALEQAVIDVLAQYGIHAVANPKAPGVYVKEKKIASVGLRIKQGKSYHGLSINNHMDLSPFEHINTCGYPELQVTQLADHGIIIHNDELAVPIVHSIVTNLNI